MRRVVVIFDITSSTTILEDLKRTDNLTVWRDFHINLKRFLPRLRKTRPNLSDRFDDKIQQPRAEYFCNGPNRMTREQEKLGFNGGLVIKPHCIFSFSAALGHNYSSALPEVSGSGQVCFTLKRSPIENLCFLPLVCMSVSRLHQANLAQHCDVLAVQG